jgi:hypothetical protein
MEKQTVSVGETTQPVPQKLPEHKFADKFCTEQGAYKQYLESLEEKLSRLELPHQLPEMQAIAKDLVIVSPASLRKSFKKLEGVPDPIQRSACLFEMQQTYITLVTILIKLASCGIVINDDSLALLKDHVELDDQLYNLKQIIIAETTTVVKNKLNGTTPIIRFWEGLMESGVLRTLLTRETLPARFLNRATLALEYLKAKDERRMEGPELNRLISLDKMLALVGPERNDEIRVEYYKTILPRVLVLDTGDYAPRTDHRRLLASPPPKELVLSDDYIDTMIEYFNIKTEQFEAKLPAQDESILPQAWLSEQKQKGYAKATFDKLIKLEYLVAHLAKSNPKKMEVLLRGIIHLYAKIAKHGYMMSKDYRLRNLISVPQFQKPISQIILKTPYVVDEASILAVMGVGLTELVLMAQKGMLLLKSGFRGKLQPVNADMYRKSLVERVLRAEDVPHKARVIYWMLAYNSMLPRRMKTNAAGKSAPVLDKDCSLSEWFYYRGFPKGVSELSGKMLNDLELGLRAMGVKRLQDCDPKEVITLTLTPGMDIVPLISDKGTPAVCALLRHLLSDKGVSEVPGYLRELKGQSNEYALRAGLVAHITPWVYDRSAMYKELKGVGFGVIPKDDLKLKLVKKYNEEEQFTRLLNLLIIDPEKPVTPFIQLVSQSLLCGFLIDALKPGHDRFKVEDQQKIAPHLLRWVVSGDAFEKRLEDAIAALPEAKALGDETLNPVREGELSPTSNQENTGESDQSTLVRKASK